MPPKKKESSENKSYGSWLGENGKTLDEIERLLVFLRNWLVTDDKHNVKKRQACVDLLLDTAAFRILLIDYIMPTESTEDEKFQDIKRDEAKLQKHLKQFQEMKDRT
jgi:hypothetical protein